MGSLGRHGDGWTFHSCGDWSGKIETIKRIPDLRMVDAAFSAATDPSPNNPARFAETLANTRIVLNARIGADADLVDIVKKLWNRGLKLIVVSYGQSPDAQARIYDRVPELCAGKRGQK